MPTVREILAQLEIVAPARYAFSFDRVGLQVGDPDAGVRKAVVSLDRSRAAVRFAKEQGAQLLLAHHPLIFRPIDAVLAGDAVGQTIIELLRSDIAFVAAHTNWDCAEGGVNDTLAELLGLSDVRSFGMSSDAVSAQPAGRVGTIAKTDFGQFLKMVDLVLGTRSLGWGEFGKEIARVAVVGGSADDEWRAAQRAGADVLVTGEVKQHNALEAVESGFAMVSAGHFATEHPGCEALRKRMQTAIPEVEWLLFTPGPGESGRPV